MRVKTSMEDIARRIPTIVFDVIGWLRKTAADTAATIIDRVPVCSTVGAGRMFKA